MIFRLSKYLGTSTYVLLLRTKDQVSNFLALCIDPDLASGSRSIICIWIRIPKNRWIRICSASNVCGSEALVLHGLDPAK